MSMEYIRKHYGVPAKRGGKVMASLLKDFSLALTEVAKVCTYGASKYSRGGWQHVPEGIDRYDDAKWRHMLAERHESHPDGCSTHSEGRCVADCTRYKPAGAGAAIQ